MPWQPQRAPGVVDAQGSLVCCSLWGHKESDMTENRGCFRTMHGSVSAPSCCAFIGARPLCRRFRGRGCANCQSLPQAELFVEQRERPGLHSQAVAWPPRLSAGSQGASERRGILWRWRGPSGLRWVWRNGRAPTGGCWPGEGGGRKTSSRASSVIG